MRIVLDIETDALKPEDVKNIWCIVAYDVDRDDYHVFTRDNMGDFNSFAEGITELWGHNVIRYDVPILQRILDTKLKFKTIKDTLVLSRMFHSTTKKHSLDEWGKRFQFKKDRFSDFTKFSPELLQRCKIDVKINSLLREELLQHWGNHSEYSINLEHIVTYILSKQQDNGFYFNRKDALLLLNEIETQLQTMKKSFDECFPPKEEIFIPKVNRPDLGYIKGEPIKKLHPFNPSSSLQIIERLEGSWKPTLKTPTGRPKVCEENLNTLLPNAPVAAKNIVKWLILSNRKNMLNNWVANLEEDDRIHGSIFSIGAWSHRMAHLHPNTANIPTTINRKGVEQLYGRRMRSMWCVPEGKVLLGTDVSGAQLRVLAHHIDHPEFTAMVTADKTSDNEIHKRNAKLLEPFGCKNRDTAKTFIYALFLGAGARMAGQILGCSTKRGQFAQDKFIAETPGFPKFMRKLDRVTKQGYILGLDGRHVPVPSRHLAMTAYLQSGEAIIIKQAYKSWYFKALKQGIDFKNVGVIHDEFQTECNPEDADKLGEIQVNSIIRAGEILHMRVPLDAEYKIGANWSETH